jgi:hypothetical protein
VRVLGLGRGQIGDSGVEVLAALGAMMLRIGKHDVAWPPADEVADIVQGASDGFVAVATLAAVRTGARVEVATLLDELRFWKIFWPRDPFRGIRPIRAGTHDTTLLGMTFQAKRLPKMARGVMTSSR